MSAPVLRPAFAHKLYGTAPVTLRGLWIAAADASDAVSAGYRDGQSESTMDMLENAAFDAEHDLREYLLTEFGLTSADLKRSVL